MALVRKEAVRKLVRTESDGAGHAGAAQLRKFRNRPGAMLSPEKAGEWCVKVFRSATPASDGVARPQQEGFTFSYGGLDGG